MILKAIAPWYGSKRTLARRIIAELGKHSFYVEPFGGSLAVLLAKRRSPMESINDLHRDLINLARVLANPSAAEILYAMAARTLMHEELHAEFKRICETECEPAANVNDVSHNHVERAYAYLCTSWMGRNGSAGTSLTNNTTARRFTSNGGAGGLRWRSAVDSIPDWHERLRNVSILNIDAFELLERMEDADGSVLYVDPPYLVKSDKYIHDLTPEQQERLVVLLRRFKRTRVVVSYYEHPTLREWYAGWTFVECGITKGLVNQGQRGKKGEKVRAPEILIINGPSLTSGLFEWGAKVEWDEEDAA